MIPLSLDPGETDFEENNTTPQGNKKTCRFQTDPREKDFKQTNTTTSRNQEKFMYTRNMHCSPHLLTDGRTTE